jgi:hypothetical protein
MVRQPGGVRRAVTAGDGDHGVFGVTPLMVKHCMLRNGPSCYALNATTDVRRRLGAADSPHAGQQPIPHAVHIHFVAPELSAQHPVLLPRPNHHEHRVRCPWQQR